MKKNEVIRVLGSMTTVLRDMIWLYDRDGEEYMLTEVYPRTVCFWNVFLGHIDELLEAGATLPESCMLLRVSGAPTFDFDDLFLKDPHEEEVELLERFGQRRVPMDREAWENAYKELLIEKVKIERGADSLLKWEDTVEAIPDDDNSKSDAKSTIADRKPHQTTEQIFLGALNAHHAEDGDGNFNFEHATARGIAKLSDNQISHSTARREIERLLGGIPQYRELCSNQKIQLKLMVLNGDSDLLRTVNPKDLERYHSGDE